MRRHVDPAHPDFCRPQIYVEPQTLPNLQQALLGTQFGTLGVPLRATDRTQEHGVAFLHMEMVSAGRGEAVWFNAHIRQLVRFGSERWDH